MLSNLRRVLRVLVLLVLSIGLLPITAFLCVIGGFVFLPLPANLPTANVVVPSQPTKLYDINGKEIATIAKFDQNLPVSQADIPSVLKQAVVASEDRNFYKHGGIDPRGATRALVADLQNEAVTQGGSTITQQYVKNAYTDKARTLRRKLREGILAAQLDRQISKDEILYRYLSTVYLGDGSYGVGAAAQNYFGKPVSKLDPSESATLVGLIPAPSSWGPRDDLGRAEANRKVVLQKMFEQHYLSQQELDMLLDRPLWLDSDGPAPRTSTLVAARKEVEVTQFPYFVDYVKRYLVAKFGNDALYRSGLGVQTTMDPALQAQAERTVAETLKGTSPPLELALASVEPPTGFVKAIVGGREFKRAQVNLALGGCPTRPKQNIKVTTPPTCWDQPTVTNGGTGRQPGSSFKPFVLAAAYEKGIQPSKVYPAPPTYYPPNCRNAKCAVNNYEGESFGPTTIKEAMSSSINTVFAPLTRDIGFDNTANMAKKLGVNSAFYAPAIHGDNGNYGLGTIDVGPLDMASAYAVFANRGLRQPATPVVKVVDFNGKVMEDNTSRQAVRIIDEAVADNVTDALTGVITDGTARRNGNIGRPAAGKTGTTEDYHDAWFVGYTPTLSTAVWMGNSTNIQTINYRGNRSVAGGTVPTATWSTFMRKALADVPITAFAEPAPIKPPAANVLSRFSSAVPVTIAPSTRRTPATTPTGDFDRTNSGAPAVAPPRTTAPPGTAPAGQLKELQGGPATTGR